MHLQQLSCENRPGADWPNALHNIICRPKYLIPVSCAHCRKSVEYGGEEAFIVFCGHIFHANCLHSIDKDCKGHEEPFFVCPACKVENFHPDCGCPIKMRYLPWTRKEALTIGLTEMEGGKVYGNCEDHEIWYALHKSCMSALQQLGLPADKPFLFYATDSKLICWMSHLGACFKKGGDSLSSNPEVKLSKTQPAIGGVWPNRDDDWTSYKALAVFPSTATIRVVLSRPNDIPDSTCWACGDLDCEKVLLRALW
ncbi:hypothetical protein B0J13DRAFT_2134 [Dactylonectria estremocensis]|uniref:RING-type domain-containing protein n=1 Tax=Dactylonectria estremocensis TaxID=1079267 RepID=A0A9P9FHU9_9HYPO|nr:hypothetical protein B0J13DRAFT_2134 [Dactylonectria estremocensis]